MAPVNLKTSTTIRKTEGILLQMRALLTLASVVVIATPVVALAEHDGDDEQVEEVVVYGRALQMLGTADSASEGVVGYDDLRLAPLMRVGELAEAVPGMVATQHSGTGKANQYFLRGFNLDHGTDFSAFVDGVPINMRTHAHGQGYLDLNFLIPELVETATYRKGPYSALVGDFSSAGSVAFRLYDEVDQGSLTVTAGSFDFYRVFGATSFAALDGMVTVAADHNRYDGPWEIDEDLRQTRFFVNYKTRVGNAAAKISMLGYSGDWNSTDQIPQRAVDAGLISDTGFIDPDLGGETDRYAVTGQLDFESWQATAYFVDYRFALYSNFTYLLEDPINGDEFEQHENRSKYGLRVDGSSDWLAGFLPVTLRWGSDVRVDNIRDLALYPTVSRQRTGLVREDSVDETSLSGYADFGVTLSESLRVNLGLRADHFRWDVTANQPVNSGDGSDTLLSPKMSIAFRATEQVELYLNWGQGLHSNDVRGATIEVDPVSGQPADPVDVMVRSEGAEVGMRFESGERFNITLNAFSLDLDSELLFVGDGGSTEALGATERKGVELSVFMKFSDWLAGNAAYAYTDSKFKNDEGGGRYIPGAVDQSASLGLNGAWDNGVFASLRGRYLGSVPLTEDNSVRSDPSLLLNGSLGWRMDSMELRLDVFNLLGTSDSDITYFYASRLPGEAAEGVDDIHFHPLEPFSARLSITFNWD